MLKDNNQNLEDFALCLFKMRPAELLGTAKILGVKVEGSGGEQVDAEQLMTMLCDAFAAKNRAERRKLIKIFKDAVGDRGLDFALQEEYQVKEISDKDKKEFKKVLTKKVKGLAGVAEESIKERENGVTTENN